MGPRSPSTTAAAQNPHLQRTTTPRRATSASTSASTTFNTTTRSTSTSTSHPQHHHQNFQQQAPITTSSSSSTVPATGTPAVGSNTTPLARSRQYTHLHAQLAQLNAHLADTENLLHMTAVQADYLRGLGAWWGGAFMAASKILGEETAGGGGGGGAAGTGSNGAGRGVGWGGGNGGKGKDEEVKGV